MEKKSDEINLHQEIFSPVVNKNLDDESPYHKRGLFQRLESRADTEQREFQDQEWGRAVANGWVWGV
jgi:hypothetical protein